MKKIIAMILALSVVLAFAACAKEDPIIETGLTIADISSVDTTDMREYTETKISANKKKFSFKNDIYKTEGVLSGDHVVEFSVYMTNVNARTYADYEQILMKLYIDVNSMTASDYNTLKPCLYVGQLYDILGGKAEMDSLSFIRVVSDGKVLEVNNWTITASLNTSEKSATIYVKYKMMEGSKK